MTDLSSNAGKSYDEKKKEQDVCHICELYRRPET